MAASNTWLRFVVAATVSLWILPRSYSFSFSAFSPPSPSSSLLFSSSSSATTATTKQDTDANANVNANVNANANANANANSNENENANANANANDNVNFDDWIADSPEEVVDWNVLSDVQGTIPDYVQGTLIRTGGGIWSSEVEEYSHIFDGLAKIHAYRIHANFVEHQTRFLQGSWWEQYKKNGRLPIGIGTGPLLDKKTQEPITGIAQILKAVWNSVTIFDNTPVNIWDYNPQQKGKLTVTALTDAPPRTTIDLRTMETSSSSTMDPLAKESKGYELLSTAHPMYSQLASSSSVAGVDTYNVGVEIGVETRVNLVRESSATGERSVVGSFASYDGIPYFHSFGLSKNYAVIVLQPLRLDTNPSKLIELGFLRAMQDVDQTRVVVMDLSTGQVVLDQSLNEKVYFFHSISTVEDNEDGTTVSLRLCAYSTPDQLTGDNQFLRLEQARKGKKWRNKIHKGGKFCDLVCNLRDQTVQVQWNEQIEQGFELPITRYSRSYGGVDTTQQQNQHPQYVYSFGAYANGSPEYDSWGLFKLDLKENKVAACYQQDSVYLSEPAFCANPKGKHEDDGVLLTQAYFGHKRETKLLVLDARTMKVLAEVSTGIRAPMDFHGAFVPDS